MNLSEIHDISRIAEIKPTPEEVRELLENPAFLRVCQFMTNNMQVLFQVISKRDTSFEDTMFFRGAMVANNDLMSLILGMPQRAEEDAKYFVPKEPQDTAVAAQAIREKLNQHRGTQNV